MKCKTWALAISIAFSGMLTGCDALVLAGGLAYGSLTHDHQAQIARQSDEYLRNVFERRTPIIARTVNSRVESNGLCILELAIQQARFDVMQDAINAGADPQKCQPGAFPLIMALRDVKPQDVAQMQEVLGGADFMKTYDKSTFVSEGITLENTALIQLGLNFGVQINDPVTAPKYYARRAPVGSTPLYMAVDLFDARLAGRVEVLKFIVASGARGDASVETLAQERQRVWPSEELTRILELAKR